MAAGGYSKVDIALRNGSVLHSIKDEGEMARNRDFDKVVEDIKNCFANSPEPSIKITHYFAIYAELFSHLRGTECTFVETGVLNGGSLFMWREWLGPRARIIGVDMNPAAAKWREDGFEILIGDQGDPAFWEQAFTQIGAFDALLDDGGHQSFQQIVTAKSAIRAAKKPCVVVIEDTCTSFMKEFSRHRDRSFLNYAKSATDLLVANANEFFPGEYPHIDNPGVVEEFQQVYSIQFYSGMVAFQIDPAPVERPVIVWNKEADKFQSDFRYEGVESAEVVWPDPFTRQVVTVRGGRGN
ncbi:hypothetical protein [Bosea sp. OK403]|uniref:hypothetical protein n=1 Tax=Bosea sp. OK403 TaxID=1855286 RepID=UPI000B8901F5|nr:hypothetical protein [Bosea sp. OK403]